MKSKMIPLMVALALAGAPAAFAHTGNGGPGTSTEVGPNTQCWPTQNPHDYTLDPSDRSKSQTRETDHPPATVVAADHNTEDCRPVDGMPFDFDGDYEWGTGGGFFPSGIYAAEPTCDYGLVPHHGPNFHVHEEFPGEGGGRFPVFAVGSDSTPPTLVPSTDPEDDDGFDCVTDGSVTPSTDPDDCLEHFVHVGTTSCLPGGDGGLWVWVDCAVWLEGGEADLGLVDADGDGIPDGANPVLVPPTGLGIGCSAIGHIHSS